jgi:hypothetical protein
MISRLASWVLSNKRFHSHPLRHRARHWMPGESFFSPLRCTQDASTKIGLLPRSVSLALREYLDLSRFDGEIDFAVLKADVRSAVALRLG